MASHPERHLIRIQNGIVLVASDGHYWPGKASTAHRALVHFARKLSPKAVIFNGDAFDGASISRHPPIGWEKRPTVAEELAACQLRLSEIREAAPFAQHIWTLGNHDSRFETRLASVAKEYANVKGLHLQDHFPDWTPCWSVWINQGVVVKHRFKGGMHAAHNNTLWAGKHMITGHLHSAKVAAITDYNGTRFGVDTGCIADPWGPQFRDYTEDNPLNWVSGFGVLTFHNGKLMWPELVTVWDKSTVQYRSELIKV